MIQGIVERRVSPRAPFNTEIFIDFKGKEAQSVVAQTTDISAGGVQFWVHLDKNYFTDGDHIQLLFELPFFGKTNIEAEVKQIRFGLDFDQTRIVHYGAKFIDITMETWNAIMDYCRDTIEKTPGKVAYNQERNDIRINAGLTAKVFLSEGQHYFSQIEDISFGGAKLRLPVSIPVKAPIKLLLADSQPLEVDGICVWSEKSVIDGQFFSGVYFNQLTPEKYSQLRSFIFHLAAKHDHNNA